MTGSGSDPRPTLRLPVGRAQLGGLVARIEAELPAVPGGDVVCRLGAMAGEAADLAVVDALARAALAARRRGWSLWLEEVPVALAELITLTGLGGALPTRRAARAEDSDVQPGR